MATFQSASGVLGHWECKTDASLRISYSPGTSRGGRGGRDGRRPDGGQVVRACWYNQRPVMVQCRGAGFVGDAKSQVGQECSAPIHQALVLGRKTSGKDGLLQLRLQFSLDDARDRSQRATWRRSSGRESGVPARQFSSSPTPGSAVRCELQRQPIPSPAGSPPEKDRICCRE